MYCGNKIYTIVHLSILYSACYAALLQSNSLNDHAVSTWLLCRSFWTRCIAISLESTSSSHVMSTVRHRRRHSTVWVRSCSPRPSSSPSRPIRTTRCARSVLYKYCVVPPSGQQQRHEYLKRPSTNCTEKLASCLIYARALSAHPYNIQFSIVWMRSLLNQIYLTTMYRSTIPLRFIWSICSGC